MPPNTSGNNLSILISAKLRETTEVDIRKQLAEIQEKLKNFFLTVSLKFDNTTITQLDALKNKANEVSNAVANVSKQQTSAAQQYNDAIKQNILNLDNLQIAQKRAITQRDAEGNKTVTGYKEKYVDTNNGKAYDVTLDANRNQVSVQEIENLDKVTKLREQAQAKTDAIYTKELEAFRKYNDQLKAETEREATILEKQIIDVSKMELLKKSTQYGRDGEGNPQVTGSKATYLDPTTNKAVQVTYNEQGAQIAASEAKNTEAIKKAWDKLQSDRDKQYNKELEAFRTYSQKMQTEQERFNNKTYNNELQAHQKQVEAVQKSQAKQESIGPVAGNIQPGSQDLGSVSAMMKDKFSDSNATVKNFTETVLNGNKVVQFQVETLDRASQTVQKYSYNLDKATGVLREMKTVTNNAPQLPGMNIGQTSTVYQDRTTVKSLLSDQYVTNPKTQTLDMGPLNETETKWTTIAQLTNKATKEVTSYKIEIDKASGAVQQVGSTVDDMKKKTSGINIGEKFSNALQSMGIWMSAATVFFGTIRSIQAGVKDIEQLDTAMTDLKKVTNETSDTYRQFYMQANQIGNVLGKTATEVIATTTEFSRLGYSLQQATLLAKEAMLYSNVGDMGVKESSSALVSAVKGFGIEIDAQGQNVRHIVDVYNEIGNHYAITSSGIGESVKRSASSMHEAGNSIEQTVALIASANSVVQDPESVGWSKDYGPLVW